MKKRICVLLGIAMLTLSACGQSVSVNVTQPSSDETDSVTDEAESVTDEVPEEETVQSSADDQKAEDITALPKYKVVKNYYIQRYSGSNATDGDGDSLEGKEVYDGVIETLMVADESKDLFPDLYDSFNAAAKDEIKAAADDCTARMKEADDDADTSFADKRPFIGPWSDYSKVNITRADSKVISYTIDITNFYGGAHGMYGRLGATYDVATGKKLTLSDIADVSQDKLVPVLKEKILATGNPEDFNDLDEALKKYSLTATNTFADDEEATEAGFDWFLGFDGVHFYFGPYEIAAYAVGETEVVLGYDEFPGTVDDKYIPDTDSGYIVSGDIPMESSAYDFDTNTSLHFIYQTEDEQYDASGDVDCTALTLKQGDKSATADDEYFYYNRNYDSLEQYRVVTKDGREYVYVLARSMNDYVEVIVFDITGGDIRLAGTTSSHLYSVDGDTDYAGEYVLTDPDDMYFADVGDMLGTYIFYGRYVVGSDGLPEFVDKDYKISWISDEIKSLKDIEATVLDGDGNEKEITTVPSGTHFTPVRTDNKSYMDCVLDDGSTVRLNYTNGDYPAQIDGVNVDDLFDGLVYAG